MSKIAFIANINDLTGSISQGVDSSAAVLFADLIAEEEKLAVSAPNRRAQELDNEINLAGAGGSLSGFQRTQQWNQYNNDIRKRNGGKADTAVSDLAILQGQLTTLDIEIAQIKTRMAELKTKIADYDADIAYLSSRIEASHSALDALLFDKDALSLDENGALTDLLLEAAIKAYEERTGETVDRSNSQDLETALIDQIEHDRTEAERLQEAKRQSQAEYEQRQRELDDKERQREVKQAEINAERPEVSEASVNAQNEDGLSSQAAHQASSDLEDVFGSASPDINTAFSTQASGEAFEQVDAESQDRTFVPKADDIQPA